jgi:beta-glucosidase
VKELKGYKRICLQPGEKKKVTFHLSIDQLAFYDDDLNLVIEPGEVEIMLGGSSEDIRLRGKIEITGDKKVFVKDRVFVCPVEVEISH